MGEGRAAQCIARLLGWDGDADRGDPEKQAALILIAQALIGASLSGVLADARIKYAQQKASER